MARPAPKCPDCGKPMATLYERVNSPKKAWVFHSYYCHYCPGWKADKQP